MREGVSLGWRVGGRRGQAAGSLQNCCWLLWLWLWMRNYRRERGLQGVKWQRKFADGICRGDEREEAKRGVEMICGACRILVSCAREGLSGFVRVCQLGEGILQPTTIDIIILFGAITMSPTYKWSQMRMPRLLCAKICSTALPDPPA